MCLDIWRALSLETERILQRGDRIRRPCQSSLHLQRPRPDHHLLPGLPLHGGLPSRSYPVQANLVGRSGGPYTTSESQMGFTTFGESHILHNMAAASSSTRMRGTQRCACLLSLPARPVIGGTCESFLSQRRLYLARVYRGSIQSHETVTVCGCKRSSSDRRMEYLLLRVCEFLSMRRSSHYLVERYTV